VKTGNLSTQNRGTGTLLSLLRGIFHGLLLVKKLIEEVPYPETPDGFINSVIP